MKYIKLKIEKGEINIDFDLFIKLFENNAGNEDIIYIKTVKNGYINFDDLKKIASKYEIPYPFFFSTLAIIEPQLKDFDKQIEGKLPAKDEIFYNSRSSTVKRFNPKELPLIIKDISKKQLFLKNKKSPAKNDFIGFLKRYVHLTTEEKADKIRNYFNIDIDEIKNIKSKSSTLEYLTQKIESKNIFISSSYNYMPQQIKKDLEFSGFCIKDNYYPWIFINNKDNELEPQIHETDGRKILTIIFLLCNIATNTFTSTVSANSYDESYVLSLEILLPKKMFTAQFVGKYEDLCEISNIYKTTPSLVLERLKNLSKISGALYSQLRLDVTENRKKIKEFKSPYYSHVNRQAKYNGNEFSRQVVKLYNSKSVDAREVKTLFFKNRNVPNNIFDSYCKKFNY